MVFICGLCEDCITSGFNLGTHYVGYENEKPKSKKNEMKEVNIKKHWSLISFDSLQDEEDDDDANVSQILHNIEQRVQINYILQLNIK